MLRLARGTFEQLHGLTQASLQAQSPDHKRLDLSSSGSIARGATPGRNVLATSPRTIALPMACSSTAATVTTA